MKRAAIAAILFAVCADGGIAQKKPPPAHAVELNSATVEQLEQVPGIGPKTAQAIVDFRQKSGPFRRIEDLLAIKGISQAKLDKMRPYLRVAPPPPKSTQPGASQTLSAPSALPGETGRDSFAFDAPARRGRSDCKARYKFWWLDFDASIASGTWSAISRP